MATNANLPSGAFITTLSGKRCTAIPKANNVGGGSSATSTATSTSSSSSTSLSSSSSSRLASTSTTFSTSAVVATTAQATTTQQAAGPIVPPAVAPVLSGTTTTAAAAVTTSAAVNSLPSSSQQQTLISTTSSTSIPQIGTQASPVTSIQATSAVTTAPVLSPIVSTSPTAAAPTTPESEVLGSETQTNDIVASTAADVTSAVGTASKADATTIATGNAALLTTIGTASNAIPGQAEATGSSSGAATTSLTNSDSGISTQTTMAVVGGVIGGVVGITLIAFLVWFWRKRIRQKRRSTMLTPLGPESGFRSAREKIPYTISRDSIGPTNVGERLKAIVGANVKKIRGRLGGHSPSSSVNLNRGNSQYMEGITHSRDSSADFGGSAKDRLLGFFGRYSDKTKGERLGESPSTTRGMKQNNVRSGSQPDFLTLLSMDDRQLAAQANKGRTSMNPRRSQSAGSNDHFLGSLNLNFDAANPFSDINSMDRDSAKVAPLVIMNPDNPFSDANAIRQPEAAKQTGPTTYVQNIRRSRGTSVGGANTRPPSTNAPSIWRDSGSSVASFATKRNKFRSDPFDLDRPELLSSSFSSLVPLPPRSSRAASMRSSGVPFPPHAAHTRNQSLSSSKYSSGIASIDQWSDPGPDVGPASSRYTSPTPTGDRGDDGKRRSGASQGSNGTVGKAY